MSASKKNTPNNPQKKNSKKVQSRELTSTIKSIVEKLKNPLKDRINPME